jgi:hypothetical protein
MKRSEPNDAYLVIYVPQAMKNELTAIAYHMGKLGMMSASAKPFLQAGIESYKSGMTPQKRAAYDAILENVKIVVAMSPPKPRKKQKNTYVKKKERGGV